MNENNVSIFLKPIVSKKKFGIIEYIKYRLFLRKLRNVSPDFGTLWKIADLIKSAEVFFFYDNSSNKEDGLYSSISYKAGENGFKLVTKDFECIVKLYSDDGRTTIEILRHNGQKLKNTYRCNNDGWLCEFDTMDEILMDIVIDNIMKYTVNLIDYCYRKRDVH